MERRAVTIKYVQSTELRKSRENVSSCIESLIRSTIEVIEKQGNGVSARLMLRNYINNCMGKIGGSLIYSPVTIDLDERFEFTNTDYSAKLLNNLKDSIEKYNRIVEGLAND